MRIFYSITVNLCYPALLILASSLPFSTSKAADLPQPIIEPNPVNERIDRAWEFMIAPYFVAANITGTTQVGRLPATDIDVDTGTILENLRFGAMLRAEALYQQKIGAMIDVAYMGLGASADVRAGGGRISVGVDQLIVEGMLFYRVYNSPQTSVDLYAGGRYWDINLDLNAQGTFVGNFDISRGDDWIDPVIGVRAFHMFNDKWSANARADIGGFGAASDFTWNLQGGVGYHFNKTWSAHFQYKALSVDYDNDKTGTDSFAYDTITHGPLLGVVARF